MFSMRAGLLIVLTSALLTTAVSQQRDQKPAKPSKSPPAQNREAEELQLSAVSLLHSLAQNVNEIENVAERVRIMAEIGDAFWSVDQEAARTMLVRTFKEIDKLSAGSERDPERLATQKRPLRRLVLSRIAKHEPSLANQLIHDLPDEIPTADEKAMQRQGVATPNADALLAIAENHIANNPKRAATIAAYSLQDGLSQRLRGFLMRLRAKDTAAADGLVAAAVSEASAQHPGRLFDVMVLWDYAYQPRDFYFNGVVWDRENESRQNTSTALKRQVLAFAVNAIVENLQQLPVRDDSAQDKNLAQAQLAELHSVIQQLLPSMHADWPRGTADLQQALVRVEQGLRAIGQPLPSRAAVEDGDSETTAIDNLLKKAAEAPQGDARDSMYLAASFRLLQLRQYERGKEVAAKIDDPERRAMIVEPLDFCLAGELIEKKRLQEALSIANQLKTPELRIAALARVGRGFIAAGDWQSGLQTLDAAQSVANNADPSIEVCAAVLRVAAAFVKSDPSRASEVITLAIQILNKAKQDETAWSVLAPAGNEDALSFSWKNAPGGGLRSVKAAYPRSGGLADLLSKLEFNQAISSAKSINKKALSLAVQATVCRRAIESTEGKTLKVSSN
jgi:hypothetical protein